jgi:putative sugar O-methyltransferase
MSGSSSLLFTLMRENYELASTLGLPDIKSSYWAELLSSGRQGYGGKGDFLVNEELWTNFRSNVTTKGLDNANVPEEAAEQVREKWRLLYEFVRERVPERFRPFLTESPIGNPLTHEIQGTTVSQSSLEYTFMLAHLEPYLSDVRTVVDIGGGYGGLARLVKLAFPSIRLVLLDLPEVSAIQTYFLHQAFPEKKFLHLTDVAELETIDLEALDFELLVIPGQLIEKLAAGTFEMAINTRSMMEMDLSTVSFYLDHIQRKLRPGGFFYCVNRYEKKTKLKDYPFDDRWYVSYSEPWPALIDANPHHEIVAGRTSHPVAMGLREHVRGFPPRAAKASRFLSKLLARC